MQTCLKRSNLQIQNCCIDFFLLNTDTEYNHWYPITSLNGFNSQAFILEKPSNSIKI